jgi:Helix-turn-helix domain
MTPASATPMSIKERIVSFDGALDAEDLSKILKVDKASIYKQARQGTIPSFRIDTMVRFDPKALCEWYDLQAMGDVSLRNPTKKSR